jgi:serine/threonine protein phosphatase 1
MISRLRTLLAPKAAPKAPARVPAGERVYAIGDIHGRADLFDEMILAIEADDAARGAAETTVVLLGDLVDRGPDSALVVKTARQWQERRRVRILAGNHEQMFLDSFERTEVLRNFLRHGGRETLLSYPVAREDYDAATLDELKDMMPGFVPAEDIAFIRGFEDHVVIGDYLFVHAGIRPGVALEEQQVSDLRWIRGEFLEDRRDHGHVVVHGHTICEDVVERPNRIGIDTGAFMSGVLTAVGLEGAERWYITAGDGDIQPGDTVQ